ncbi:MAG TPA: deoxyguanosinetriphosphate triphosphohydrolase [Chloroflexi bacterium]|nr:deoxyguanosinetriphosphate triphosphohydrolase [Chloroflexota bacterium]
MLLTRDRLEEMETAQLAPYAQASRASRGRAHPEDEHPYRTAFQRDRDRILHTTAFRRLEYKTQVFVNYEGDHYRTRLTHTLEVAQIARTIARTLMLNQDLVEAIAMAHDLGHTPFGHTGEVVLHALMAERGGFNHNTHGLRIVEKLEERYPGFLGLNLTWEVREGIVKHATEYDTPEASDYEPHLRATLEAQVINVADEIAYNTHDLDDGLRSGLLNERQLRGIALWDTALEALGIAGDVLVPVDRNRVVRYLVNAEVSDVLSATAARLQEAQPASVDDVRRVPHDLVGFSEAMEAMNRELKDLLFQCLYRHWRVMRVSEKSKRVLTSLFEAYLQSPVQLPEEVQARIGGEDDLERVICDYMAGMTDRFALEEYRKMFDPVVRP